MTLTVDDVVRLSERGLSRSILRKWNGRPMSERVGYVTQVTKTGKIRVCWEGNIGAGDVYHPVYLTRVDPDEQTCPGQGSAAALATLDAE